MDGPQPGIITDADLAAEFGTYGAARCGKAAEVVMGTGTIRRLRDIPQDKRPEFLSVLHDAEPGQRKSDAMTVATANTTIARPLVDRLVRIAGDRAGKFILCAYGEGVKEVRHVLNGPDAGARIMSALAELAAIENANVYILPGLVRADLPEGQRGKMGDVVSTLALVADFDRHEGPSIDWAATMPVEPGLVAETSPGNHQCWIFLDRPFHPDEVRAAAAALVKCTGCDPVTSDMDHVFRAPGGLNWPNAKKIKEGRAAEPFQSRLVSDKKAWLPGVSLKELRGAILKSMPDAFDDNTHIGASNTEFAWDQRKKLDEPCDLLSDEAIARALSKKGDRSALAFKLIRRLQRANYSAEEIAAALLKFSSLPVMMHFGAPADEQRVRADVQRAFSKPDAPSYEGSAATVFRILGASASEEGNAADTAPPFRTIKIQGGARPENVNDAEAALVEQRVGLFQRVSMLVRPAEMTVQVRGGKRVNDLVLVPITAPELIEHMTSAATFVRWDARTQDWKRVDCPREIAETMLSRVGRWNLRPLMGIINAPTLRPDGSLLDRPGYDEATGLLYDPRGVTFPSIPDRPTRDDARRALTIFDELIGEFPFASGEARAVALAAFLTICIRRTLPAAPLFGIDGTGAGSGKGLLADTIATVGSGRPASPITAGANEEELEKRVASMLIRGDLAICIDNLSAPLESTFLCSVLTQETQSVRVLGQSKTVTLPTNAVFMATGNGLAYAGDMWRRGLNCLIDPAMERPSERVFAFNPVERAKRDRGRYVAAALTILRAYQVAGMPEQDGKVMGSFETWCRTVRDALLWLGEADAGATCVPSPDDPERERFAAIILGWQLVIGEERGVTLKDAIGLAVSASNATPRRPELLDAFHAVAAPMVRGGDSQIDARRLGYWLRSVKRQVIRGLRLIPEGESQAGMRWRLERAQAKLHDDQSLAQGPLW